MNYKCVNTASLIKMISDELFMLFAKAKKECSHKGQSIIF